MYSAFWLGLDNLHDCRHSALSKAHQFNYPGNTYRVAQSNLCLIIWVLQSSQLVSHKMNHHTGPGRLDTCGRWRPLFRAMLPLSLHPDQKPHGTVALTVLGIHTGRSWKEHATFHAPGEMVRLPCRSHETQDVRAYWFSHGLLWFKQEMSLQELFISRWWQCFR